MNHEFYMRRCLQLARQGRQNAKPNPMVGAVIVAPDGRIIGEGYHARCGEGHAEVNAFASVRDEDGRMLSKSTMYVSLEPCSHYGRTPPCADLIISKNIKHVVVGCVDPFAKVEGRGIKKMRDAGIEVTVGVLEKECLELNRRFITFNTKKRPYITLKWCKSADGFLDDHFKPAMLSTSFTRMLTHKLRAENDAILVGRITAERDKPKLDVRHWYGPSPMRIVLDSSKPFCKEADFSKPVIPQLTDYLYAKGIQSLLVEGGSDTHQRFIEAGMWDEIRVETSTKSTGGGTPAPILPQDAILKSCNEYDGNIITLYRKR